MLVLSALHCVFDWSPARAGMTVGGVAGLRFDG